MKWRSQDVAARRARITRPRSHAVTASSTPASPETGNTLRRLSQQWQNRALSYYDSVGECWYPAQFYARTLQKVRFFPAIIDERGDPQEEETGPLVDLFERVQDPGGGRSELVGAYGRLMFLTGDGYLIASEQDGEEAWEFLSPAELTIVPDTKPAEYRRLSAPGLSKEELVEAPDDAFEPLTGNEVRVYRLWRRHPAYTQWADSPVRAVLDLYQLLTMLTLATGAESQSRAAQRGLLYIPDELDFGVNDPGVADDDPQADPFAQELQEMMMRAIRNPGSAEAMAPAIMRGPAHMNTPTGAIPMKDCIGWMPLGPTDRYLEIEAWEKTIGRIAYGLDLPPEFVTGTSGANHWGAWILDEQGFRQHVAPVAQKLCDDIASAYLRPAAIAAGIPGADRVAVGYDPAEAVNHPDEVKTAQDAYDRGVVSADYYRDKIGATEDDAPTPEELEQRLPPPGVPAKGETAPTSGGRGGDVTEAPPAATGNGAVASAVQAARIIGAAELAVERARELAGARLRSRSQHCDQCLEKIRDVPAAAVASTLGVESVRGIINGTSSETELVAGAGDALTATVGRWGVGGEWPVEMARMVEAHALRTLYELEAPPLPAGFAAVVARALQ